MIVVDASVLIGYLDARDRHHPAAEALLVAHVDDDIGVNSLTLTEVLVAPAKVGRLDEVLDVLRELDSHELPFPADTATRLAHLRVTTRLKLPDCCVSFDIQLLEAAVTLGLDIARPPV